MERARDFFSPSSHLISLVFDALEAEAVAREKNPSYRKKLGDVSDGVWRTIGGLPEADDSWNGKIALVSGAQDMNTEDWPVKIDGTDDIQMVREENLHPFPFDVSDDLTALIATVDTGIEAEILWDLMQRMAAKKSLR